MPNTYIDKYVESKKRHNVLGAMEETLLALKMSREKWGYQTSSGISWRGGLWGLKLFYNPETTKNNIAVINEILEEAKKVSFSGPQQAMGNFSEYVESRLTRLSAGGHTKELLQHILIDLKEIQIREKENFEDNNSEGNPETDDTSGKQIKVATALSALSPNITENMTFSLPISVDLNALLHKKNLSLDIFKNKNILLNADISEHAQWAFASIYSIPYPHENKKIDKLARVIHGMQHVSRVAINVRIFANLYIRHGDLDAAKLTEEDVKLLQIAALFHDSAREGEAEDLWDNDSAIFLYHYLTEVLLVDKAKAKLIAEASANKDIHQDEKTKENIYYQLHDDGQGNIYWEKISTPLHKNIYQKIIHDADCLEIIRARATFKYKYLDFYQTFADSDNKQKVIEEILQLKQEARSFIANQGDTYKNTKPEIKLKYEHAHGYRDIVADIDPKQHKMLHTLYAKNSLLSAEEAQQPTFVKKLDSSYDGTKEITAEDLHYLSKTGRLFSRAVATPSGKSRKKNESMAGFELRKYFRQPGSASSTQKANRFEKHGNPKRSISMLAYDSGVFADSGFLLIDLNLDHIQQISASDANTGHGKKGHLVDLPKISIEEKKQKLAELLETQKTGGETFNFSGYESTHTEILYHIHPGEFKAIFYSHDPNLYNVDILNSPEAKHPYAPILNAIFLQIEYANRSGGVKLPIFEYSSLHDRIEKLPEQSEEDIINMWVEMCSSYMRKKLDDKDDILPGYKDIFNMSIDDIKISSMNVEVYGDYKTLWQRSPADSNYPEKLQKIISERVEKVRCEIIEDYTKKILKKYMDDKDATIFDKEILFVVLQERTIISASVKEKITAEINDKLKEDIFSGDLSYKSFDRKGAKSAYKLTVRLGLNGLRKEIEDKALETAENMFINITNKLDTKHYFKQLYVYFEEIENIIHFSKSFGIVDSIKYKIEKVVYQFFNDFSEHVSDLENLIKDFQRYWMFIEFMAKNGLLNNNHKSMVRDIIARVYIPCIESERCIAPSLTYYLHLARLIEIPFEKLKETTLDALNIISGTFNLSESFSALKSLSLLDDVDVFNKIIDKIKDLSGLTTYQWLCHSELAINLIKKNMSNGMFTEKQVEYIINTMNIACEILISRYNKDSNEPFFEYVCSCISAYSLSKFPFPIPNALVSKFTELLTNLPKESITAKQLELINETHQRLPKNPEREQYIAELNKPNATENKDFLISPKDMFKLVLN